MRVVLVLSLLLKAYCKFDDHMFRSKPLNIQILFPAMVHGKRSARSATDSRPQSRRGTRTTSTATWPEENSPQSTRPRRTLRSRSSPGATTVSLAGRRTVRSARLGCGPMADPSDTPIGKRTASLSPTPPSRAFAWIRTGSGTRNAAGQKLPCTPCACGHSENNLLPRIGQLFYFILNLYRIIKY
ncbi:hypothetical protein PENTCL1PPCAC_29712, partial [Pristionchus entomophagus]